MFYSDMQIFDCWRSVRPVLFGPSVRRQSFPLFSPGQFSNCNCRNQLVPGMKHQMGQHGAHSECHPIPGQLLDSWMAFPYVSASCCRNFLHILATTFSASLEFLLVLFLAYFFSLLIWFFFFFVLFLLRQQKPKGGVDEEFAGVCVGQPQRWKIL